MRKVYVGKTMYVIFHDGIKKEKYVQPCKVTKVEENGFYANCHNSEKSKDSLEFFSNDNIGKGVYFSKDTANLKLKESL